MTRMEPDAMATATGATFRLSREDFTRLQKVVQRQVGKHFGVFSLPTLIQGVVWFFVTLAGFTVFGLVRATPRMQGPLTLVAALFIVALIALLARPWLLGAAVQRRLLFDDGLFLAEQTVSIDEAGFDIRSRTSHSRVAWGAVLLHDEDRWNDYLFLDATQVVVLPKSLGLALPPLPARPR